VLTHLRTFIGRGVAHVNPMTAWSPWLRACISYRRWASYYRRCQAAAKSRTDFGSAWDVATDSRKLTDVAHLAGPSFLFILLMVSLIHVCENLLFIYLCIHLFIVFRGDVSRRAEVSSRTVSCRNATVSCGCF